MRVGITYNLRDEAAGPLDQPEDLLEEFDSPETIEAIAAVIGAEGHDVVKLGFGKAALEKLLKEKIDFVFNIAEGYSGRSREAHIPAVCEMLNIPYSGPDPLTASLTLDKVMAKRVAVASQVTTPKHYVIEDVRDFNFGILKFPVILKLAYQGSSKGIREHSKAANVEEAERQAAWLRESYPYEPILAEQFIAGREVTAGVVGDEIIGLMEIIPTNKEPDDFIYSLEVKRDYLNQVKYQCPAQLSLFVKNRIEHAVLALHKAFGCRDSARFDFRIDSTGTPYFLEVNPLPGLNPVSGDLVIMSRLLGIEHADLIRRIFFHALKRYNLNHGSL
ncbi:MAG: D-alanine--D-alanine ligase [Pseudomonadota bacterium]